MRVLRIDENSQYQRLIGIGGIGAGIFFELEGDHTLGRNESRPGRLLDVRDYCKLHIMIHYVAQLLGAQASGSPFHVVPVGRIGDDAPGHQMVREMAEAGIDTAYVRATKGSPTLFSVCFQYPDGAGGNITTNNSAAAALSESDIDEVAGMLKVDGKRTIALAAPEVPLEARCHFLRLATNAGAFRAASFVAAEVVPARQAGMFDMLDLVSLNEEEAAELVGSSYSADRPEVLIESCQEFIRNSCPNLRMVVSVGKDGAYGLTKETTNHCAAPEVKVSSTAGAGDSLLGGIIAASAAGIPFLLESYDRQKSRVISTGLELGVLLASYKCLSPHTIHPVANIDALFLFAESLGYTFSAQIAGLFREVATS